MSNSQKIWVKELQADLVFGGQEFLVSEVKTNTAKNGKAYADVKLGDKTGTVSGKIWDFGSRPGHDLVKEGAIIRIDGKTNVYNEKLQVVVDNVGPACDLDYSRYERVSEFNPKTMLEQFHVFVDSFENEYVRKVASTAVGKYVTAFATKPAATGMHHAFKHGLLEHTLQMLQTGEKLFELDFYAKNLNKDLCMFGLMFHDYGKIFEYGDGPGFKKTEEGLLDPHIPNMASKIEKIAEELEVPREIISHLKHVILAHHRFLEWGSPVKPATPEALFIHYVDNLHGDVFGVLQKLEGDMSADIAVKYGFGEQSYTMLKKRFNETLKEFSNDRKISVPDEVAGQEAQYGGF